MSRIKLVVVSLFITGYLGFLAWGVAAHALKVGLCGNTISYFAVWDMFCGWSAWDQRTHFIAEGASGEFYELKEPWGEFHPFGNVARIHYDHTNHLSTKHIQHLVNHTLHEPIDRVYTVQEVWPKQYNLPPGLYKNYFEKDIDRTSYFHVRAVLNAQGKPLQIFPDWFAQQHMASVYDNPRLQKQSRQASSMYNTLYTPRSSLQSSPFGMTTN